MKIILVLIFFAGDPVEISQPNLKECKDNAEHALSQEQIKQAYCAVE